MTEVIDTTPAKIGDSFRLAHAQPSINLATEAWLTVARLDGSRDTVSLTQLLAESHQIAAPAEPDPLIRAALHRYLIALTAQLIHLSGNVDLTGWNTRLNEMSGFTQEEINTLLGEQSNHLYLFHPETPFLQDQRFLDSSSTFNEKWHTSSDELVTALPGPTSRAWAFKPGDPGVGVGLHWREASKALVGRWFYGLSGNGGGGDMGGAFPNGTESAPITHIFRIDPRGLFGTLLRNLIRPVMTEHDAPLRGPSWMDPQRPRIGGDALYRYTTTATSALLGPTDQDGRVWNVLRGSIDAPAGSKEVRKAAKQAARDDDPHRIRRSQTDNGKTPPDVRLSAAEPALRRLAVLRRGVVEASSVGQTRAVTALGIVNDGSLWLTGHKRQDDEHFELAIAHLAGSATSPQWAATTTMTMPSAHLDPDWARAGDLDFLLDVGFGDKGVYDSIRRAVTSVFRAQEDPKRAVVSTALVDMARRLWLCDAEVITEQALDELFTLDEAESQFWRAGRGAVSEALSPYASSTRYAGAVVQAISSVRSRP